MTQIVHNHRLVVLDTETTGLSPQDGHRIIEIGCIELLNRRLTGRRFHVYLNPERLIDAEAIAVHGITNEFLRDKPRFAQIADEFLSFIDGAELIIHNAPFDVGFINYELLRLANGQPVAKTVNDYSTVFDTLAFARKKHAGQRNSLDALCKRYSVDNSNRELHGALLDAQILADVFLLMTGGQSSLLDESRATNETAQTNTIETRQLSANRTALTVLRCSDEELQAHESRLQAIDVASAGNCLWHKLQTTVAHD